MAGCGNYPVYVAGADPTRLLHPVVRAFDWWAAGVMLYEILNQMITMVRPPTHGIYVRYNRG